MGDCLALGQPSYLSFFIVYYIPPNVTPENISLADRMTRQVFRLSGGRGYSEQVRHKINRTCNEKVKTVFSILILSADTLESFSYSYTSQHRPHDSSCRT